MEKVHSGLDQRFISFLTILRILATGAILVLQGKYDALVGGLK